MTQTEDVVRLVRRVFGADLVGVYSHGSAVLDGLRPHSDLDVLVVSRRGTSTGERRTLVAELLEISGRWPRRGAARPVELTVVVQSEVRPWRYPPRCEFLYGEWLRAEYERGDIPGPALAPDLAPVISMVLLGDTPLCGPSPREVLDPVPHQDLRQAIVAGVPELLGELLDDTRNVLLTLARVWTTLATGVIRSKDAAAAWALGRLPAEHRAVLAHARAGYLGEEEERWDDLRPRLRPHVDYVVGEIDRLAARGGPAGSSAR